jgi:hypothetical protein
MALKRDVLLLQESGPELDRDHWSIQFQGTSCSEEPPVGQQQAECRPDASLGAPKGTGNTVRIRSDLRSEVLTSWLWTLLSSGMWQRNYQCFVGTCCLHLQDRNCSSTLKMKAPKKFANICQNTRCYIPEVSNIHQQLRLAHFHWLLNLTSSSSSSSKFWCQVKTYAYESWDGLSLSVHHDFCALGFERKC